MGLETDLPEGTKNFLRTGCLDSIQELQDKVTEIMNIYKQNPTFPFDFYNMTLRETDTRILAIRDLYKRLTGEELE